MNYNIIRKFLKTFEIFIFFLKVVSFFSFHPHFWTQYGTWKYWPNSWKLFLSFLGCSFCMWCNYWHGNLDGISTPQLGVLHYEFPLQSLTVKFKKTLYLWVLPQCQWQSDEFEDQMDLWIVVNFKPVSKSFLKPFDQL